MATTNDLKNGMTLNLDGQLWNVVDFQHVKPGKGGAFVRTKLKNILSGKVVDRTFNAGVKVDVATVDRGRCSTCTARATTSSSWTTRTTTSRRSRRRPSAAPPATCWRTRPRRWRSTRAPRCTWNCPPSVELTVSQTDPGVQGDRSTGGTKPATLETGAQIQVPLFITTGEKVRVDTRTGDYLGRA